MIAALIQLRSESVGIIGITSRHKETVDGVHVPIERRPVIIRLDSGKIYLDELRQNGRGFFLVDKADCTGEQFGSCRLSSLKRERGFLCPL